MLCTLAVHVPAAAGACTRGLGREFVPGTVNSACNTVNQWRVAPGAGLVVDRAVCSTDLPLTSVYGFPLLLIGIHQRKWHPSLLCVDSCLSSPTLVASGWELRGPPPRRCSPSHLCLLCQLPCEWRTRVRLSQCGPSFPGCATRGPKSRSLSMPTLLQSPLAVWPPVLKPGCTRSCAPHIPPCTKLACLSLVSQPLGGWNATALIVGMH
jgi:hypothetical protein